jgi:retron-type reverse transcriptase
MRESGIPTVLDRFVHQLILQVLHPIFDPTFSEQMRTRMSGSVGGE